MAKLRHIALWVRDLEASARFYESVFDMKRVGAETIALGSGIYLSDGVVNLALLRMADADETSYVGTHHFGFVVDDLDLTKRRIEEAGGKFHFTLGDPTKSNFESKFKDPDGIVFDISKHGWDGIS